LAKSNYDAVLLGRGDREVCFFPSIKPIMFYI